MSIKNFLLERIAEDEKLARDAIEDDGGQSGGFEDAFEMLTAGPDKGGPLAFVPRFGEPSAKIITWATPRRILAECAAKRAIIKQHDEWPVLVERPPIMGHGSTDLQNITYRISQEIKWQTEGEYVNRFGAEPPTAPMIRTLAAIYSDHPDYQPEWTP